LPDRVESGVCHQLPSGTSCDRVHRKANITEVSEPADTVEMRHASVTDAAEIWRLVCDCDVLDKNSCYAYLLICRDFSATSLVAFTQRELLGFVAAYVPPSRPDVVFVWQIGTAPAARNKGVAKTLLRSLLRTPACRHVRFLEATVTPSNTASARLFRSIADELKVEFRCSPGFQSGDFGLVEDGAARHEPEDLVRIGPIEEQL